MPGKRTISSPGSTTCCAAEKLHGEKINRLKLDGMLYYVDTLAEWNQIFSDTWRWYRDFFYDANMHGQDWRDVGERYRAMIPASVRAPGSTG